MEPARHESQLFELLTRNIHELEQIEDNPQTLNFVSRRLGNIVKHMKDLRDDLQPRGGQGDVSSKAVGAEKPRTQAIR